MLRPFTAVSQWLANGHGAASIQAGLES